MVRGLDGERRVADLKASREAIRLAHALPGITHVGIPVSPQEIRHLIALPETPVLVLDVNADMTGDVTDLLEPYTLEANRALVGRAFAKTSFLAETPESNLDRLSRYPGTTSCEK